MLLARHTWSRDLVSPRCPCTAQPSAPSRRQIAGTSSPTGTRRSIRRRTSADANAVMLGQFLDALRIDQVDLVGNDSGGGIALIFAARHPERVRMLTLTDCDAHDNWPPSRETA